VTFVANIVFVILLNVVKIPRVDIWNANCLKIDFVKVTAVGTVLSRGVGMTKMNRKLRNSVYNKYGGKCAYCGVFLEKGWHVDHLKPLIRMDWARPGKPPENPENDTPDNLMPSCPSCNINKHSMDLETWRRVIEGHIQSLNRQANYRMAKKFGQLVETPKMVVFYFENSGDGNEQ